MTPYAAALDVYGTLVDRFGMEGSLVPPVVPHVAGERLQVRPSTLLTDVPSWIAVILAFFSVSGATVIVRLALTRPLPSEASCSTGPA